MASASPLFVVAPPPTKPLAGAGLIRRPEWRIPTAARGRSGGARFAVRASATEKERATLARIAAAVAVALAMMSEAAQAGILPSLKNFLLSIVAGGVVLGVIVGVVIAVANFDLVKRT